MPGIWLEMTSSRAGICAYTNVQAPHTDARVSIGAIPPTSAPPRCGQKIQGRTVRYFFNIIEGPFEIPDPEGSDLPNEEAAQREALAIAADLLREFPGRFGHTSVLEVFSENGRRIIALPIMLKS
jgi:hypothetical protein